MALFTPAAIEIRRRAAEPQVPATIGEHGRKLWQSILAEWDLDSVSDLAILEQAAQAYDRAERMRLLIAEQGEMISAGNGSSKPNGCIALELQARALCAWLVGKLHLTDEPKRSRPAAEPEAELLMVERRQLTEEHVALWREGCAELKAMTRREWSEGRSERYRCFLAIDKALTWSLVGPHSASLFDARLDGPCDMRPEFAQAIDRPASQAWRRALIEATGETPKTFKR
jgi:hypothetical protein